MPAYAQTSTSLGALSSATSGSWVNIPAAASKQATPIAVVVASSVTSGAVIQIEGRNASNAGYTSSKILHKVTIAADGNTIIPLADLTENGVLPDQLRLTVVSRTDGTYTGAILTAA